MSPQTEPEPPPDEIPNEVWRAAAEAAARAPAHITLRGVVYAALRDLTRQFPPPDPYPHPAAVPDLPAIPTPPLPELRAQVAELTRQGLPAEAIGRRLGVSARTVKRHRAYTNTSGRHSAFRSPYRYWSAAEEAVLADTSLSGPEVATRLDRTVESIYRRRSEKGIRVS